MFDKYYKNPVKMLSYAHTKDYVPGTCDFHLHDNYEIYFFISGNINYFIEKNVYSLKYGDLLIMNTHEIHRPSDQGCMPYERIVLNFDPKLAKSLSSPDFDLTNCFVNRKIGEHNRFNLNENQISDINSILKNIEISYTNSELGCNILVLVYFTELLVYLNKVFMNSNNLQIEHKSMPDKLIPILQYIEDNIDKDLSLDVLEHSFYINKFYLSRLFKKVTGSNLHEFILYKRISRAKQLLSHGNSAIEACSLSGFNDYSNFHRIFKRTVGVSPGKYKK